MSTQPPGHARVIPLRPASAARPAPPAAADRGPARPADGLGRPPVRPPRPAQALPPGRPAPREPLWRHIVGDVLRRERLDRGLRLKDVAGAAQISMPYLSEIERGRKEASSEILAAAARALGLGLADLLALAQAELARFAQIRRARTGVPATPERTAGVAPVRPAPASEAGGDAAPTGRLETQDRLARLTPPSAPHGPRQLGRGAPPRIEMSLAA